MAALRAHRGLQVIDSVVKVGAKIQLIEDLQEMNLAYRLMSASGEVCARRGLPMFVELCTTRPTAGKKHPDDENYGSLQCALTPLDHDSDEFKMIEVACLLCQPCLVCAYDVEAPVQTYVRNTHAATHGQFALVVEEVCGGCSITAWRAARCSCRHLLRTGRRRTIDSMNLRTIRTGACCGMGPA